MEHIGNLVPEDVPPPQPKGKLYKSMYPGTLAPSWSTFNNFTTSRPGVFSLTFFINIKS
jgi:hypothetical protein